MPNVIILETGMGGCRAAYRLHGEGVTPVMYDKNAYHGGHTASFRYGDWGCMWTDESFKSEENAADRVLFLPTSPAVAA